MERRVFITTTNTVNLRPLAWQGVRAIACYEQLARILQSRLTAAHLALLAEPIPDSSGENVDWYAHLPEMSSITAQPVKFTDLPLQTQEEARRLLFSLQHDIFNLARELQNGQDSNAITAGTLLENCLAFPGEEYVYLFDGQPVITAWGYLPSQNDASREELTRLLAVYPTAAPIPSPENNPDNPARSRAEHTGWGETAPTSLEPAPGKRLILLFPAFLLGAALMALLLYFGTGFLTKGGCSRTVQPASNATNQDMNALFGFRPEILREQGREEVLRAELERLRYEYQLRLLECRKPEQSPQSTPESVSPPAPEEKPLEPQELVPPLPELALPELPPDPPPAPQPQPERKPLPQTPKVPEPKTDYLEIPNNSNDLAFLEGCWEAEIAQGTPGRNALTQQRLVYCFDADGNGQGVLSERRSGREICVGGAKGELNGNSLRIKDRPPLRPRTCIQETIICRNAASGVAQCSSRFETGGTSKLVFRRK